MYKATIDIFPKSEVQDKTIPKKILSLVHEPS